MEKAKRARDQLLIQPDVAQAYQLAQQFRVMVRDRKAEALNDWIATCRASGIGEIVSFADGLGRELPVIGAALERNESNGITEGHVNRLKMLKRAMYGRASLELLRRRVLAPN